MSSVEKFIGESQLKSTPTKKFTFIIDDEKVTTAKIADNAITKEKISGEDTPEGAAVTTSKIKDGAVTNPKIANGAVTTIKIQDFDAESSFPTGVTNEKLADESVTESKLASGAVTEGKIAPNAVTAGKIADGAVIEGNIAAGAVTHSNLTEECVQAGNIANGAVENGNLAPNAVQEGNIAAGAIHTEDIHDGAVTTAKIEDYNPNSETPTGITTAKIADEAITEGKLADGAITTEKLATPVIEQLQTITDAVPTAGSVKPVQSNGVYKFGIAKEGKDVSSYLGAWGNNGYASYATFDLDASGHNGTWTLLIASGLAQRIRIDCNNLVDGEMYRIRFVFATSNELPLSTIGTGDTATGTWHDLKDIYGNSVRMDNGTIDFIFKKTYRYLLVAYNSPDLTFPITATVSGFTCERCYLLNEIDKEIDSRPVKNSSRFVSSGGVAEELLNIDTQLSEKIQQLPSYSYAINTTGKYGTSTSYSHIAIPVNAGEKYILSKGSGLFRYAFATNHVYSSGANISLVENTEVVEYPDGNTVLLVIPDTCQYLLIFNVSVGDVFKYFQLEPVTYNEQVYTDSEKNRARANIDSISSAGNKLGLDNNPIMYDRILINTDISIEGTIVSGGSYVGYKAVNKGDILTIVGHSDTGGNTQSNISIWFTENKPEIGNTGLVQMLHKQIDGGITDVSMEWVSPSDGYAVVRYYPRSTNYYSIYKRENITKNILNYYGEILTYTFTTKEAIDTDEDSPTYGDIVSTTSTYFGATDYIDIEGAVFIKTVVLFNTSNIFNGKSYGICFYDLNKDIISGQTTYGFNAKNFSKATYIEVPSAAKYARFTVYDLVGLINIYRHKTAELLSDVNNLKTVAVEEEDVEEFISQWQTNDSNVWSISNVDGHNVTLTNISKTKNKYVGIDISNIPDNNYVRLKFNNEGRFDSSVIGAFTALSAQTWVFLCDIDGKVVFPNANGDMNILFEKTSDINWLVLASNSFASGTVFNISNFSIAIETSVRTLLPTINKLNTIYPRLPFTTSIIPSNYTYSKYMDISSVGQGSCIYENYFVGASSANSSGNLGIRIYNLETKTLVTNLTLSGVATNTHANTISFGSKYDENDLFPLLYVPTGYANNGYSDVYVCRITGEIGNLNISIIQTIHLFNEWTEWVCADNNTAWIKTGTNADMRFRCYEIPELTETEVTIDAAQTIMDFTVAPQKFGYSITKSDNQDFMYNKGRIWFVSGVPSRDTKDCTFIGVVNVRSQCLESVIWLDDIGLTDGSSNTYEPEGIFIWNNQLYVAFHTFIVKIIKVDLV